MEIKWLNAVIDLPAESFDRAGAFWADVTDTRHGPVHPDHDEFVHLLPASGDMTLELQRIDSGPPRVHLDLVVDDIPGWTERAQQCGATVVATPGHSVLETPGGVPFCIVPHSTESEPGPLIDGGHPHAADQICLDVPHEHFDADVRFWADLTGWKVNDPQMPEFRSFDQPANLPLRILIQRLGTDDTGVGRAHLDISSGEHVAEIAASHELSGATLHQAHRYWTALTDPAGMQYCVTSRPPNHSGTVTK